MATMNNVTIKSMKNFKGHDGEICTQGNIYLGNKKLGFWSQDSWCGPDIYEFDTDLLESARKDFEDSLPNNKHKEFCKELDCFLAQLVHLKNIAAEIKRMMKKGNKSILLISYRWKFSLLAVPVTLSLEEFMERYAKNIEDYKKDGKCNFHMFYSADINLTCDKAHPLPDYLSIGFCDDSE